MDDFYRGIFMNKLSLPVCIIAALVLAGCACNQPEKVEPFQKTDKEMSCKQVVLETTEIEYRRKQAADYSVVGIDQALLPLCWAPTYVSKQDAIKAADERLEYLGQIYELLGCDRKQQAAPQQSSLPSPPPIRSDALPRMQRQQAVPMPYPSAGGANLPPPPPPPPAR